MSIDSSLTRAASAGAEPAVAAAGDPEVPPGLALAFAPMHKLAFGVAAGAAAAFVMALVTIAVLVVPSARDFPLGLMSQYFFGYTVSWPGVIVGAAWAFLAGFVAGWFAAFCRNLAVAVLLLVIRVRSELTQTRDFLDHI